MCGDIGVAPSEFYRLQYCELELMLRGYTERVKRAARHRRELAAEMASWLLLPHQDKDADPITADTLLGRKPRKRAARAARFASPIAAFDAFFTARSEQERKSHGEQER